MFLALASMIRKTIEDAVYLQWLQGNSVRPKRHLAFRDVMSHSLSEPWISLPLL